MTQYVPVALRWLVAIGKVLSILAGLSAYQGMIPPKYTWAAVLAFAVISSAKEIVMIIGDLLDDGQRNSSFRLPLLLVAAGLGIIGLTVVACTSVPAVPPPSAALGSAVETRAAAITKAAILAHPSLAPWMDVLAAAARSISADKLPSPEKVQATLEVFAAFAPAAIAEPISRYVDLYRDDYGAAVAIQGTSAPWLERLAVGIQTGEQQAGLGEAP